MARAKRTDRTEARRRYRADQDAGLDASADVDELVPEAAPAPARRKGTAAAGSAVATASPASAGSRPARPGFMQSARAAYRPARLREDLPLLPRLLIHWSVLVSAGLAVLGTAIFVTLGTSATTTSAAGATTMGYVASIIVSLFVGPPPFGAALLIGFMLPRATYLVGFAFGLLASACFTVVVLVQPSQTTAGAPIAGILAQVWVLGPVGTMFFAAGIAWYKRFLDLLNPNRGQRSKQQPQKAAQGRGNAPRNRLSGSGR